MQSRHRDRTRARTRGTTRRRAREPNGACPSCASPGRNAHTATPSPAPPPSSSAAALSTRGRPDHEPEGHDRDPADEHAAARVGQQQRKQERVRRRRPRAARSQCACSRRAASRSATASHREEQPRATSSTRPERSASRRAPCQIRSPAPPSSSSAPRAAEPGHAAEHMAPARAERDERADGDSHDREREVHEPAVEVSPTSGPASIDQSTESPFHATKAASSATADHRLAPEHEDAADAEHDGPEHKSQPHQRRRGLRCRQAARSTIPIGTAWGRGSKGPPAPSSRWRRPAIEEPCASAREADAPHKRESCSLQFVYVRNTSATRTSRQTSSDRP